MHGKSLSFYQYHTVLAISVLRKWQGPCRGWCLKSWTAGPHPCIRPQTNQFLKIPAVLHVKCLQQSSPQIALVEPRHQIAACSPCSPCSHTPMIHWSMKSIWNIFFLICRFQNSPSKCMCLKPFTSSQTRSWAKTLKLTNFIAMSPSIAQLCVSCIDCSLKSAASLDLFSEVMFFSSSICLTTAACSPLLQAKSLLASMIAAPPTMHFWSICTLSWKGGARVHRSEVDACTPSIKLLCSVDAPLPMMFFSRALMIAEGNWELSSSTGRL